MNCLDLRLSNEQTLRLDRPVIMGILNVTPDSFSDGGAYPDVDAAASHAQAMLDEGADIIDVGGESTRPGSQRVDANEQINRVIPVIERLHQLTPEAVISIDTTLAPVAQAALSAGAAMLNDISAGRDDPAMFELAAKSTAPTRHHPHPRPARYDARQPDLQRCRERSRSIPNRTRQRRDGRRGVTPTIS